MDSRSLTGVFTAIVTPFADDYSVDKDALRRLVDRQIEAGVQGLVPCGTTGEAAALTAEEHQSVVATVVEQVGNQAIVLAGAGSNNTQQAIALSRRCEDAGADGLLHVAPYYVKPTQDGLIRHYDTILDATSLPIVLYNVPGRTAVTIAPETALHLAQSPNVIGIKQAVSDLSQLDRILAERDSSFGVLSGDDALTLPMISLGADGVVSVVGNQHPRLLVDLVAAAMAGRHNEAIDLHRQLAPLMAANFVASNPIPVKFSLSEAGLINNVLRTPLTPLSAELERVVIEAMMHVKDAEIAAQVCG